MAAQKTGVDKIDLAPTTGHMVLTFLLAAAFGILSIMPWLELKDAVPLLFRALGGYKYADDFVMITTLLVLGVVWLVLFLLLWNRLEKKPKLKDCLFMTLKWCACSLGVYVLAFGMRYLAVVLATAK